LNIFADWLEFLFHDMVDAMLGDFTGLTFEFIEKGLTALFQAFLHFLYRFFYYLPFDKFISLIDSPTFQLLIHNKL
jgi:hypothetical protein